MALSFTNKGAVSAAARVHFGFFLLLMFRCIIFAGNKTKKWPTQQDQQAVTDAVVKLVNIDSHNFSQEKDQIEDQKLFFIYLTQDIVFTGPDGDAVTQKVEIVMNFFISSGGKLSDRAIREIVDEDKSSPPLRNMKQLKLWRKKRKSKPTKWCGFNR
jgi:hypothetical protein